MLLSRRSLVSGAAAALLLRCHRQSEASPGLATPTSSSATAASSASRARAGPSGAPRLLEWTFDGAVSTRTAVLVPTMAPGADAGARFPVLVALHGRGETRRTPAEGALGWPRDYGLARAFERVSAPPLTATDFEGLVDPSRLASQNRDLADRPFGGLVIACPYVPDLDLTDEQAVAAFGRFVRGTLLPRIRRETPALPTASATGIDGVSLGGALSLAIGLDAATEFGAVGTLQPAIDEKDLPRWLERAQAARRANPRLALRLVTSDGDFYRDVVREASSALDAAGVRHDFELLMGPHDYPFNRGPGSIEMLLWHDRVLRSRA